MFAIYGFCRDVDDIADEPGRTPPEQLAALEGWRADLRALYSGEPGLPPGRSPRRSPTSIFRKPTFSAVVDGMAMDVGPPIRAPASRPSTSTAIAWPSAVGRLSVRVFGMEEQAGRDLAHHLGRALQFTNILRDLDEDAGVGRLYLPAEALAAAGIHAPTLEPSSPTPAWTSPAGGWRRKRINNTARPTA